MFALDAIAAMVFLILVVLIDRLLPLQRRKGTMVPSGHGFALRKVLDYTFLKRNGTRANITEKTILGTILLIFSLVGLGVIFSSPAEADSSVTVKNETGYDLEEVKYVQELGTAKSVAGRTHQLANGGSHTFRLKEGGAYRVYASFIMSGKRVYAKGNANNLRDGGRYILTLKKVVISQSGSSLSFINQSEFDAIK
jgi:hypothetical protein